ncbi:MAG: hypothetical protein E6J29_00795 [Chloroflexi bacterium]|nr:MAG: hypothetical protein E6J29_00795 [Chloroflexota bacterium]
MTRPEQRLARALDRLESGGPAALGGEDRELLETAGYLRESLTTMPAPDSFRRELRDWLAQPRPEPWWRPLTRPRRRPVIGAAVGLSAAAVVVGVLVLRRRRLASVG